MLLVRLATSIVLIPIVLVLLYLGDTWLRLALVFVIIIGCHEFYGMFNRNWNQPFTFIGTVLAVGSLFTYGLWANWQPALLPLAFIVVFSAALIPDRALKDAVLDAAITLIGVIYLSLVVYLLQLRGLPNGLEWSLSTLLLVWAADTGAYAIGRPFGRHKMIPKVSPGKTWEGVAGGTVATIAVGILCGSYLLHIPAWQSIILALLVTFVSILGDLVESLLKRSTGVKDSGFLIPGHGGLLDRIDGLLFALPAAYYFALLITK